METIENSTRVVWECKAFGEKHKEFQSGAQGGKDERRPRCNWRNGTEEAMEVGIYTQTNVLINKTANWAWKRDGRRRIPL